LPNINIYGKFTRITFKLALMCRVDERLTEFIPVGQSTTLAFLDPAWTVLSCTV